MAAWLKRLLPSLFLDASVVLALVLPEVCTYLRWPLLGLYALLSWVLVRQLSENRWVLRIVRDPATRIAHGLEHATMAVLAEQSLPVRYGLTHGRDRFIVALEGHDHQLNTVREAVENAIRRMSAGERSLAYHPGCGTSELVSAASLWVVYVTCVLFSLVVGGAIPVFFAASVIVFRLWLACDTAFGLLAQRLLTVSTTFASASVVDVREYRKHHGDPEGVTRFEIFVDVEVAASEGGLVAPGTVG